MRLFILILAYTGVSVFGAAYQFPLLQYTLGGLDKADGVHKTRNCQIFDDAKIDKDKVLELILRVEKEPITQFFHNSIRLIPSVELWANYPTRVAVGTATALSSRKILILEDSSSGRERNGKAAAELTRILEDICKVL